MIVTLIILGATTIMNGMTMIILSKRINDLQETLVKLSKRKGGKR